MFLSFFFQYCRLVWQQVISFELFSKQVTYSLFKYARICQKMCYHDDRWARHEPGRLTLKVKVRPPKRKTVGSSAVNSEILTRENKNFHESSVWEKNCIFKQFSWCFHQNCNLLYRQVGDSGIPEFGNTRIWLEMNKILLSVVGTDERQSMKKRKKN